MDRVHQSQPAQETVSGEEEDGSSPGNGERQDESASHRAPRWGSPEGRTTWEITARGAETLRGGTVQATGPETEEGQSAV